ncbi:hypothetical protein FQZ97_1117020 [compost metagenome]
MELTVLELIIDKSIAVSSSLKLSVVPFKLGVMGCQVLVSPREPSGRFGLFFSNTHNVTFVTHPSLRTCSLKTSSS